MLRECETMSTAIGAPITCSQCGYSRIYRSPALANMYMHRHSCERHLRRSHRAQNAIQRAERGLTRGCRHARVRHEHGTRAAYVSDRCRCAACREANRVVAGQRRRAIAYGGWNPYVAADEAREHVGRLSDVGIGLKQLARLSGVPYSTLSRLMWGHPSHGDPPSERIRPHTSRHILAVPADQSGLADGSLVNATGTRRRLQALVAIGWTRADLARELGRTPTNLRHTMRSAKVKGSTAIAVRELYQRLWNTPPEERTAGQQRTASDARAYARQRGWLVPLAWDDIDTDRAPTPDQVAVAHDREGDVDELDLEIAVERVLSRRPTRLNAAELDGVVRALTERGYSLQEIAELLDVSPRTVSRHRSVA